MTVAVRRPNERAYSSLAPAAVSAITPGMLYLAIEEIKNDMTRPVPMNRLLCGDVGYGKTEVALRAAFKAIMGGKQVAILVPTTILALQHFETATARMRNYPVTVEMISRFRTPKQQANILKKKMKLEHLAQLTSV